MSKFNQSTAQSKVTTNLAGGRAYKLEEKEQLATGILTSFFNERGYYDNNKATLVTLIRNVASYDPKFVANLAVFARKKMFLRSISHVIAAELAFIDKGSGLARQVVNLVCERPDDMTEILSYYLATHGKPIPNSIKKGLADAMKKFDEYQLAKYNRKQEVALRDVLRIAHPIPADKEQEVLFGKLKEDTLATPYTWEVELSAKGNNASTWYDLIASKKVGYMATLRNLRNIVQTAPKNISDALSYIANPTAIKNSKQIPFRFFSAHRELQQVTYDKEVLGSISKALELSCDNMLVLPGRTLLIHDTSGSMDHPLSERSSVSFNDVGALMCATAHKFCEDATLSVFSTEFAIVKTQKDKSILENVQAIKSVNVGYSTNLWKAFDWLCKSGEKFDRIIVFSDMQAYDSRHYYSESTPEKYLNEYRRKVNPNVWIHSVDLTGRGTSQFAQNSRVNLMAGWNTNILEYMIYAEAGVGNMIKDIEGYQFK